MLLSEILKDVEYTGVIEDTEICGITCDSRKAEPGYAFVCISGSVMDGHEYAPSALRNGASCIVAERDTGLPGQILVQDSREAYAVMCANYCGRPAEKLHLIGVTGTNGKTTITYLIKQMLEAEGKKVGLIGTIQNLIGDVAIQAKYTTPEPMELNTLFGRMLGAGCEYIVMEVSSMALDQRRVEGCLFDTAIFTNLTQDHLDYHGTMENYFEAKKKLFGMCKKAVICIDDEYGRELAGEVRCPVITVSAKDESADITAFDVESRITGCRFAAVMGDEIKRVKVNMPGSFSVSNALVSIGAAVSEGLGFSDAADALSACPGVKGRMEIIPTPGRGFTVIRDFAHGPDALKNLLDTVKECGVEGRILTLFGCAGRRDRTKRADMGRIVAERSDIVIYTSDNPREEPLGQIEADTAPGFEGASCEIIEEPDRYEAIKKALSLCRPGDTLVLAGKGHEEYQVLDFGTIYFDEKVIVENLLEEM